VTGRTLSLRDWVLLALASLVLFLPGFATLPPVDRDEGRYIVSSQRMAETGDFVDIRYQDQPRYLQPAGIYWLQSISARVFDSPAIDSVWAYRIPSLLAALLAVMLTGFAGARFFGRSTGIWAALLLAACLSLNFEARIAKTDATLLAAIVAAQVSLMRLYTEAAPKRWLAALFWAALGAGLMVKGPIILIVIAATVTALLAWDRKFGWLKNLRPLWGPLVMLAIALPWYVAIGIHTDGAFYDRAIGQSMMGKVADSQQGHSGPPGYHLALFALMFWPGSLLAMRAAQTAWRRRAEPAIRFLLCWIVPTWIIFEIVATKLPHYVLPTYPAIACLCALALSDFSAPRGLAGRAVLIVWTVIWIAATLLLAALGPVALRELDMALTPGTIALSTLVIVTAGAALWFLWKGKTAQTVLALAACGLFGAGGFFGYTAPSMTAFWMSPRINELVRAERPCGDSLLVTTPYTEPSLVFLYGRTLTRLSATGARAAQDLADAGPCAVALIGAEERAEFTARAEQLGLALEPLGEVAGRNYSNGDNLQLTLYGQSAGNGGD
jgi:4-amino-4-deoxy-L-arabinose transferase-like glycosyltransferase